MQGCSCGTGAAGSACQQKVEGSNPFSRPLEDPHLQVSFVAQSAGAFASMGSHWVAASSSQPEASESACLQEFLGSRTLDLCGVHLARDRADHGATPSGVADRCLPASDLLTNSRAGSNRSAGLSVVYQAPPGTWPECRVHAIAKARRFGFSPLGASALPRLCLCAASSLASRAALLLVSSGKTTVRSKGTR